MDFIGEQAPCGAGCRDILEEIGKFRARIAALKTKGK
jgi:hypothetical protein